MSRKKFFDVDTDGLAKILTRRGGVFFAILELIQNAWDQNVKRVLVELEPIPNRRACWLRVEDDDAKGFSDLTHAFTLCAESDKKSNPMKRGRFNLGEKLVIAVCEECQISST